MIIFKHLLIAFSLFSLTKLLLHDGQNLVTAQQTKKAEDINYWCDTTPHPDPCKYFMGRDPALCNPKSQQHFRSLTIQVALDRATDAQTLAGRTKTKCRSKKTSVVYRDCNDLIETTIFQLNTTLTNIQTNSTFTYVDSQTWLSAALTNIEICRKGSQELNVTRFTSPILSGNVSELISNCLATNGLLLGNETADEPSVRSGAHDYPAWVTAHDRNLLQDSDLALKANVVVAKDGSGNFGTVQAAINYAMSKRVGNGRVVVYVKSGVYRENLLVGGTMNKVMLIGDGIRRTVITGGRSVSSGFTTYSSATVGVDGIGFIARGVTFRNEAGPQRGQAVALRSASDLSVFYGCSFEGYQDTLFVQSQRQFYKSCYIYGTIDFIFGNAAVVFQSCVIYVRKPLWGQANVITAQGRGDPFQNTGISIHSSRIMPAPDLKLVAGSYKTYLGRPWQQYSRTVIMKSYMDGFISPDGWSTWENSNFALSTLYYGEYQNSGPGSSLRNRVRWPGYHVITSVNVANRFTVSSLISGRAWLPSTGVPFVAGL